ncbi:fimbria/pilus outer membrane usher protein [Herbaspirillum sp. RTI4]|uniref:fimbria/pilus outer membrane usher protein n=1 Tax=Herbaspirillum sp. RTI4 TaxID=3048640 RepID=UPI002AB44D4E|nr:fimbria/pilus outer membrane usher protein [Herbaspirillum sp. RTI4]MDY7577729.1 fimbria/pilus outer membrane usher protein [Herbaspirillum sp. RTI4]MEA9980843.1 fimbria/pilus outer membrane usher protein [Herbaspirillum sp. RTI4]
MNPKLLAGLMTALLLEQPLASAADNPRAFDVETLKARGFPADLAEFFKDEKRFMAGASHVVLFVNGVKLGRTQARFDKQGQLCVDKDLLARANISAPAPKDAGHPKNDSCLNLQQLYPQSVIRLRPGKEEVELIVPQQALLPATAAASGVGFARGGTAGLLNYDAFYMKSKSGSNSSASLQANTETGLNAGDWTLRARQAYSKYQGKAQFSHLDAYAQKSLPEHKLIFQAGQINAAGSMFDTPPLLGAQLFPEGALLRQASNKGIVTGIAQSTARVEVRQGGALIYTTTVPPGPFRLTDLTLNNTTVDLEVTVTEENGVQQRFAVLASSFALGYVPQERSFSIAIGKPWRYGSGDKSRDSSKLLMVTRSELPLKSNLGVSIGTLTSSHYHGLGTQLNMAPTSSTSVGLSTLFSYVSAQSRFGVQTAVNASAQLHEAISASASYSRQGKSFRTYSESLPDAGYARDNRGIPTTPYVHSGNSQLSVNLSYNNADLGALGVGYSKSNGGNNTPPSRRLSLSWGRNFGRVSASVNLERSTGATKDMQLYASINIPFGTGSVSSAVTSNTRSKTGRINYSDRINEYISYNLAGSTDNLSRQVSSSASLAMLPKYARLNLGISQSGSGSSSYNGRLTGGVVIHDQGVTLTPYPVRDTFTLISSSGHAGIRIQTPEGPVWTDYQGMAVATLNPYTETRLEMSTKSLPRNADVKNGMRTTGLSRGAVGSVVFDVTTTRRVLLKILNARGAPMNKGASVFDSAGKWITSVGGNGSVFLTGEQLKETLKVTIDGDQTCLIKAELPAKPLTESYYEHAETVCRIAS